MSWNPKYVVLILFTTFVSYLCAIVVEKAKNANKKKIVLVIGIVASLAVLFIFKYLNFTLQAFIDFAKIFSISVHPFTLNLLLPVGVSFYTFQTLSYVIDVYRQKVPAEKNFAIYALYVSFFPQLVAGPIERSSNLIPQFKEKHYFNFEQATYGLKIMAWGFFKKVVVADTFSIYVDKVYNNIGYSTGFAFILATILFAFQIYCDFSGYTDIAIGSAQLLGFKLMKNFDSPYFSTTIKEFWRRWHISLSSWFMEYVYIPLGGSRVKNLRHYFNIAVTFLVSGLWHGANWTFVFWGGLHGCYSIIESYISKYTNRRSNFEYRKKYLRILIIVFKTCFVFSLICFAWVFFRASSISAAFYGIAHCLDGISNPFRYLKYAFWHLNISKAMFAQMSFSLILLILYDGFKAYRKQDPIALISKLKAPIKWGIYSAFIFYIILFGQFGASAFIYFQF
jgi:D-alanyl-lipoteichoic acid acyltransferase DltB (MBOAT superfamily)